MLLGVARGEVNKGFNYVCGVFLSVLHVGDIAIEAMKNLREQMPSILMSLTSLHKNDTDAKICESIFTSHTCTCVMRKNFLRLQNKESSNFGV